MQLHFVSSMGGHFLPRAVLRLAAGTVLRHMEAVDADRAFKQLAMPVVHMPMVRMEQVGMSGVPMESPLEPGTVEHRKAKKLVSVTVHYNEISMVLDRVMTEAPGGRDVPAARDFLDAFAMQLEAAGSAIIAWCDESRRWEDRAHFIEPWSAALDALRNGRLARPYEFAATVKMRHALDAAWALVADTRLEAERYEPFAEAYILLLDAG